MRRSLPAALCAVVIGAHPQHARADEPSPATPTPRHAIEVGVAGVFERMTTSAGNMSGVLSSRRGGNAVALSFAYRTPYFLMPFVDIAYYPLYESTRTVDLGSAGGSRTATGGLSAVGFVAGPAIDLWRIRLRAGVGAYDVMVRSSVLGQTIRTSEMDMGYFAAVDGYVLKSERVRVGLEVRAAFITEVDVTAIGLGLTIAGDVLRF